MSTSSYSPKIYRLAIIRRKISTHSCTSISTGRSLRHGIAITRRGRRSSRLALSAANALN